MDELIRKIKNDIEELKQKQENNFKEWEESTEENKNYYQRLNDCTSGQLHYATDLLRYLYETELKEGVKNDR